MDPSRMKLWVKLTFGQKNYQDKVLGQVDIWSDFRSGWHLVKCTPQDDAFGEIDIWSDLDWSDYAQTQR